MDPFWAALALTVLAGASTAVGGALGAIGRPISGRGLAMALGLAAGVMVTVSLAEMMPAAREGLATGVGSAGGLAAVAALLAGAGAYLLLDHLLPEPAPPAPADGAGPGGTGAATRRMARLGAVTAAAIAAHNLPEGFVTFAGALEDPSVGLALAIAMAVHNVPEGIAVAVPVRTATGSRRRAFTWAAVAGVAEPVGALVGYLVLAPFLTPAVLGAVYGLVSGVMVALSLHALLPEAQRAGGRTPALLGALAGIAVMLVSLDLLA